MSQKARKILIAALILIILGLGSFIGIKAYQYYHVPEYDSIVIESTDDDDTTDGPRIVRPEEPEIEIIEDSEVPLYGPDLTENAVGWLTLDGTEIDDAVIQYTNNDRYLRYNDRDEYDVWGAYFVNCDNDISDPCHLDRVTTIFGHSNGQATSPKFANLKLLRKPEYAQTCRSIELWLGNTKTTWRIFAVGDYPVNNDYLRPNPDDEFFTWELGQFRAYSYNQYDVEVSDTDKILILSTCTGSADMDTRYIVCAKLTEIEEH